jgi:VIT1/CCC1 family predicted Fe2+/Mn2+ transporter
MSMAASAFLSARAGAEACNKTDEAQSDKECAIKTAMYTGIAYIATVFLLVSPYALLSSPTTALVVMLLTALGIIAFFNFYLSVARDTAFRRGFTVMAGISTFVAIVSYTFGYFLR